VKYVTLAITGRRTVGKSPGTVLQLSISLSRRSGLASAAPVHRIVQVSRWRGGVIGTF